jgi:hypothetical protein
MRLSNWKDIIQQDNMADRKSWMSSTFTMRYCPLCFAKHNIPYLRLSWSYFFSIMHRTQDSASNRMLECKVRGLLTSFEARKELPSTLFARQKNNSRINTGKLLSEL